MATINPKLISRERKQFEIKHDDVIITINATTASGLPLPAYADPIIAAVVHAAAPECSFEEIAEIVTGETDLLPAS